MYGYTMHTQNLLIVHIIANIVRVAVNKSESEALVILFISNEIQSLLSSEHLLLL